MHEGSLLMAVRAIYSIYLKTASPVNKMTAKACLQQLTSYVFAHMEQVDAQIRVDAAEHEHDGENGQVLSRRSSSCGSILVPLYLTCPDAMYPGSFQSLDLGVYELVPPPPPEPHPRDRVLISDANFPTVLHKDAYLIFRALCKLSNKPDSGGDAAEGPPPPGGASDARQLESKLLSLELLLSLLEHSGPVFRTSERFISCLTQMLCVSILKNCTSDNTSVVGLSLRIFVVLIQYFKEYLKAEIEVFVTKIFLRILESDNSSYEHKKLVMDVVCTLCSSPQTLIEIFLNYDCDADAIDLYKRIVNALAKVGKGKSLGAQSAADNGPLAPAAREELQLRSLGLEGLIIILTSLLQPLVHNVDRQGARPAQSGPGDDVEEEPELVSSSPPASSGNGSAAASSKRSPIHAVHAYDKKKKQEEEIANGIIRFNLNPFKGIAYFQSHGLLGDSPLEVAQFLHRSAERLDKGEIGEYLGREKDYKGGFHIKVLHAYVEQMNFTGMEFDDAIRHYLSGFRLPGEAQKIDRMMEKFAEHYCLQNPATFPSADTAFILAFSIIMLNTDLHNPAIREDRKMTKAGFISNNRGIADGANLEEEFLEGIFNRIKAEPISLKEDDDLRQRYMGDAEPSGFTLTLSFYSNLGQASDRAKRQAAFEKERVDMVRSSQALVRQRRESRASPPPLGAKAPGALEHEDAVVALSSPSFLSHSAALDEADAVQYVRAMFEEAWGPMLGVFSQVLEECCGHQAGELADPAGIGGELIKRCLVGCRLGLRLSAQCLLQGGSEEGALAREAFMNSLAKFTLLDSAGSGAEIRPHNLACIQALLDIALEDGDFLEESWGQVLRLISQLARLLLSAGGQLGDDVFFSPPVDGRAKVTKKASGGSTMFGKGIAELNKALERSNAAFVQTEVDAAAIDRIFSNSVELSTSGIRHLVNQLCGVSRMEISASGAGHTFYREGDGSHPRIFCLQRLVEVADFNMDSRGRIVWAGIWETLNSHFIAIGAHDNPQVAMYVIDSLRQLAFKFMVKEELRDFNFQRVMLRPFEVLASASNCLQTREFIVRCIEQLVHSRGAQIRSGWKSIFAVLSTAVRDPDHNIAQLAWSVLERLVGQEKGALSYDFLDVTRCLLMFVSGSSDVDLSLKAVDRLRQCAAMLGAKDSSPQDDLVEIIPPSPRPHLSSREYAPESFPAAISQSESHLQLWWPLLFGLSESVSDPRREVRHACLNALMSILHEYGRLFSTQTWALLIKGIIMPMLESAAMDPQVPVRSALPPCSESEPQRAASDVGWAATTGPLVLKACSELLLSHMDLLCPLLPEMLAVYYKCVCQERESLAVVGLEAFRHLMQELMAKGKGYVVIRTEEEGPGSADASFTLLDCIVSSLCGMLQCNLPKGLLEGFSEDGAEEAWEGPDPEALMTQLVMGDSLIPIMEVQEIFMGSSVLCFYSAKPDCYASPSLPRTF